MAQVAITKLIDGPRNAVFHVALSGDGSGDLTDETLIDPAVSFTPALPSSPCMTVDKLWYDLSGFSGKLEFDYLTSDVPVWTMAADQSGDRDFCSFGGLKDRSPVLDGSGKLMLTTKGLGADDFGTIIVWVRKD